MGMRSLAIHMCSADSRIPCVQRSILALPTLYIHHIYRALWQPAIELFLSEHLVGPESGSSQSYLADKVSSRCSVDFTIFVLSSPIVTTSRKPVSCYTVPKHQTCLQQEHHSSHGMKLPWWSPLLSLVQLAGKTIGHARCRACALQV